MGLLHSFQGGADIWLPAWRIFHQPEADPANHGYAVRDWQEGFPPNIATKSYGRSSGVITETTTLTIIHKPRT